MKHNRKRACSKRKMLDSILALRDRLELRKHYTHKPVSPTKLCLPRNRQRGEYKLGRRHNKKFDLRHLT